MTKLQKKKIENESLDNQCVQAGCTNKAKVCLDCISRTIDIVKFEYEKETAEKVDICEKKAISIEEDYTGDLWISIKTLREIFKEKTA